ncbi:3-methyladenine DNA glycosylase [Microbacterium sp. NPDC076911]|uniref:3-methyladenine DNA glycosylase n=1 Tax=Microbacterium sp. NPDC076911 TaxID=3154958 RepID=UPI00342D76F7
MPTAHALASQALAPSEWNAREQAHHERADALTYGRRQRASRGQTHPVDDFLYTYYSYKPAILRRWHPGEGVRLDAATHTDRAGWRWYIPVGGSDGLIVDGGSFRRKYGALIGNIGRILRATAGRNASFRCFGLHEWAMIYRDDEHRHDVPLRLGQSGTNAVVESHELGCTHFDAFRFFTHPATTRNSVELSRESQPEREQPGCLHAGMDLYKWAIKLGPLVPGELLLNTFALAREIRVVDMRASPYDLTDWGFSPIKIETAQGKADYVAAQREFTSRAQQLRQELLTVIARE